jgi:hypothetical protein
MRGLVIIGCAISFGVMGQNLVTNGSFETYTTLPSAYAQLCLAQGWTSASSACGLVPGCGHPDYFHLSGAAVVRPPTVVFGTCMPHSGNAMIGFTPWYLVGVTNFREYPRFTLSAPMVVGQSYTVSFWTSNGTNPYSGWGCNNLGVAFTMAPLAQTCGAPITGVTPQLEITTIVYSSTWQLRIFTFTPTQPFQYMCIGNFHNDAGTAAAQMSATGGMGAYYFLDDVSVQSATPLPIELLIFDAWAGEHRTVELAWATASERDNARFEVERSTDGSIFSTIGNLPGAGTSEQRHDYAFTDQGPSDGVNYYRIRQVDIDGASTTTDVRSVIIDRSNTDLAIWPVPSSGDVYAQIGAQLGAAPRNIVVSDMLGRTVMAHMSDASGHVLYNGLAPGSYLITVQDEDRILAQGRCVVQ